MIDATNETPWPHGDVSQGASPGMIMTSSQAGRLERSHKMSAITKRTLIARKKKISGRQKTRLTFSGISEKMPA
ncbi:MAG: hypothetical protein JO105_07065 [Hyphomicrobiales bacterium]|nr:hypothetical protein [Hyphomicrobiales bacterium]